MNGGPSTVIALIENEERRFYENFDPFYFYTLSQAIGQSSNGEIRVIDKETEEKIDNHEILEKLTKSQNKISEYQAFMTRALRYFCAETLLLLLVSGPQTSPFIRSASLIKPREFGTIVRAIADKKIPEGSTIPKNTRDLSFLEWLSEQCFGQATWDDEISWDSLVTLISEEMKLLQNRGALNAFKHGKPKSFGDGLGLQVKNDSGDYVPLNKIIDGFNWIEWNETKGKEFSLSFNTEELNPEQDGKKVFAVGLLMNAICQVRLMQIDKTSNSQIHLPNDFETGLEVKRQKFSFNFEVSKEHNET